MPIAMGFSRLLVDLETMVHRVSNVPNIKFGLPPVCREECAGSGMRLHTLPFADNNESAALFSSRGR